MSLKLLTLLLFVAVATAADSSSSEDHDSMDHEYHVHVHHPAHDSGHHADDEDQIDVHIHNPHAAAYHPNNQQNYIIHIHEDTADGSSSSSEEDKKHKKVHRETDAEKKAAHGYWDNIYHFFVEDHEEHYDYAECDIVADVEHSEGVNLTGRVVFKQNVHGGPLYYQVELHGFKSDQPDHGMHIHEYGDIIKDCTMVGKHYNPTNAKHGGKKDKERHIGDFGDVHANENGDITKEYYDKVASLHGPHSVLGRALVIDNHKDEAHDDKNHHMGCCVIARSPGENWHDDWPHVKAEAEHH